MPQSAWITHVKNYANENNCSYKEALSKASASYKKQKGEGCCDKIKEWRERKKIHPREKYEENESNLELLKSPRQTNKIYVKPLEQPTEQPKKEKKNKKNKK